MSYMGKVIYITHVKTTTDHDLSVPLEVPWSAQHSRCPWLLNRPGSSLSRKGCATWIGRMYTHQICKLYWGNIMINHGIHGTYHFFRSPLFLEKLNSFCFNPESSGLSMILSLGSLACGSHPLLETKYWSHDSGTSITPTETSRIWCHSQNKFMISTIHKNLFINHHSIIINQP